MKPVFIYATTITLILTTGTDAAEDTDRVGGRMASDSTAEPAPAHLLTLSETINKLGFRLFSEVVEKTPADSNVFISPLAAAYALSVAYNGASGVTREEIGACLELNRLSTDTLNGTWRDLMAYITARDSSVEVGLAGSLWTRFDKVLKRGFIECLSNYGCRHESVDFSCRATLDTMNAWISRATRGRIDAVSGEPDASWKASVLQNAVYFNGAWKRPFDTARTARETFHFAGGGERECQLMSLRREDIAEITRTRNVRFDPHISCYVPQWLPLPDDCVWLRKTAGVTLPYGSGSFRMTVLVPYLTYEDSSATIDTLLDQLTWETWQSTLRLSKKDEFSLWLPKFQLDCTLSLDEVFQSMGMRSAFQSENADFSSMFADGVGWIDEVVQTSSIRVNEKGTQACIISTTGWYDSLPADIRADKPFVIVVHEESTGVILFIGKVANPSWDSES